MTKQLRYRIMITMMILLSITFISIMAAINIWTHSSNIREADSNLRSLMMQKDNPDRPQPHDFDWDTEENPFGPGHWSTQHPNELPANFIFAIYSLDGEFISLENTLSDSINQEKIKSYCEEILAEGKHQGTIGHLRYTVHSNSNRIFIAFIDHSAAEKNTKNLLLISIVLGVIGLVVFAFISYVISGLMVRPVEDAFEKQKQFISDASHELKTPITVILSNTELLEDQIGENKQISYIKKECDQMHHLVSSLLTLTHLEQTPYTDIEKNDFSLSDALWERILPFESVAYEKGITMEENILPDVTFWGVKEQLQQVAGILIDNALSHTEKNGSIIISLKRTQHHILFTVSNTGDSIPDEERENIFERFYRIDKARNRASGHYGLGLSIAKTIVDNHKGHIRISCDDGITSFIVSFKQ